MSFRLRRQGQTRRIIVWSFAVVALTVAPGPSPVNASTVGPPRKIDLSFLGKVVEPPLNPLVQFVDNRRLAVAIVVHNVGPPQLVRRGETGARSAFVLHAAIIDANTGKVLKVSAWPTDSPRHSGLVTAANSKLVVLLGDRVALYSRQLVLLKQLKLPGENGQPWTARASPSGRNTVFVEDTGLKPGAWAWVDTTRLRVLHVWKDVPPEPGRQGSPISDSYITITRCLPPGGVPPCKLTAYSLNDEPARTVGGINLRYGAPEFVSDNLLFVHGWSGNISVVNLAMKHVIRRRSPGFTGNVFASPASAPGVLRFVVPVFGQENRLEYLDVFDGPAAHLHVFHIRGVPSAGRPRWFVTSRWSASLSPDGRLLATMENFHTLLIFKLPPPERH